jgi:hypothetical protein
MLSRIGVKVIWAGFQSPSTENLFFSMKMEEITLAQEKKRNRLADDTGN